MPVNPKTFSAARNITLGAASLAVAFLAGRRTAGTAPSPADAKPEVQTLAVAAAAKADPAKAKPETAASKSETTPMPPAAAALLKTLDPSGGLKSQATILQYASSLDLAAARAVARSFEGKGWSSDRNLSQLRQAVFTRWAELDAEGVIKTARTSADYYTRWNALSAGFNAMVMKNPDAAWARAAEMGPMKTEAQRSVINSLSSIDPAAAFARCSKMDGLYAQWSMDEVVSAWADRDPLAAGKAATGMPPGKSRASAISGLMSRWSVADYDSAAAWAGALPTAQERVTALSSALDSLSRLNPQKALTLLDSAEVGNNRANIVNSAIGAMAMTDFDGALARATSFPNFVDKQSALGALTGAAGDEERAKLLKLAETLPANLARSLYQNNLWQRMYEDPAGLAEAVAKIPMAAVREQALNDAAQNMSYYQPEQAAGLFSKLQSTSQKPEVAGQIAGNMAQTNPEKALEWANGLGNEALKKAALSSAIQAWAGTDPARAGQELSKITNPDTRSEVTRSVAQALAGRSLKEAENWANSLAGADQSAALGSVVEQAATQAPDRVEALYTRFANGLSPEDAARSENQNIAKAVANQMAQTDATRAAAWSLALPEGGARDEAVSGVVSTWAGYDAIAASEWLQNLPEGKGRDLAAGNLVGTIARDDPDGAWAWATSISDPARRRDAAAAALAGWKANGDRAAAQAALDSGNFSEADHTELARKLE